MFSAKCFTRKTVLMVLIYSMFLPLISCDSILIRNSLESTKQPNSSVKLNQGIFMSKIAATTPTIASGPIRSNTFSATVIRFPLDVLFIIDRSSPFDANLNQTKCLLKKLTDYLDVDDRSKVRICVLYSDETNRVQFSFQHYSNRYNYNRAFEAIEHNPDTENTIGQALSFASTSILKPNGLYGARQNVPKVVIVILGSTSHDVKSANIRTQPYTVTLAAGYGKALQKEMHSIATGSSSVVFSDDSQNLCNGWRNIFQVIRRRLEELCSVTPHSPDGFYLKFIHASAVEIGWKRPTDLVRSYSVEYKPLRIGTEVPSVKMNFKIGQSNRVLLQDLETSKYELNVKAIGFQASSSAASLSFDTACGLIKIDSVVLIDTSIMSQELFELVRDGFLTSYINGFIIGSDKSRVGIILYSEDQLLVAPLSTYVKRSSLFHRLRQLEVENGIRNTGKALRFAYDEGLRFARQNVLKVLVVITAGNSHDPISKKGIYGEGYVIFHVKIGNHSYNTESDMIASSPTSDYIFEMDNYEELKSIQLFLLKKICADAFKYAEKVNPPLSPPKNVEIRGVRPEAFEVVWDKEKSDLLTGYWMNERTTGQTFEFGSSRSHFLLDGLLPGHSYNISIWSKGRARDSRKIFLSITTELPRPLDVSVAHLTEHLIRITWINPSRYVIRFQVDIIVAATQEIVGILETNNSTTTVDTDVILPGTEYEIKIKAIYIDEVISEAETIYITTDLPTPNNFFAVEVGSTDMLLSWTKLDFKQHFPNELISYRIQVYDRHHNLEANKRVPESRTVYYSSGQQITIKISELTPAREYSVILQTEYNGHLSNGKIISVKTNKVKAYLDIGLLVEISPYLQELEIQLIKKFLISLLDSFDLKEKNKVRISITQLAYISKKLVSWKDSHQPEMIANKIDQLSPSDGSSALESGKFIRVVKEYRPAVPRVLIFVNTNQHHTNLMPENKNMFSDKGITTIIVQMARNPQPPEAIESKIYRYILESYNDLYRSVKYLVVDSIRAEKYPLLRVEKERSLIPIGLTIFNDKKGRGVIQWWAPNIWPDYYVIRVKFLKVVVWKQTLNLKRRVRNNVVITNQLKPDTKYSVEVSSFKSDGTSAKVELKFRTTSSTWTTESYLPYPGAFPGGFPVSMESKNYYWSGEIGNSVSLSRRKRKIKSNKYLASITKNCIN